MDAFTLSAGAEATGKVSILQATCLFQEAAALVFLPQNYKRKTAERKSRTQDFRLLMPIFLTLNLYGPNKASEKKRKYCPTPCWSGESRTSYLGFLPSTICNCKLLRGVDILRDPFIREWSPVGRQKSAQSKGISTWSILNYFLPTPGCNLICLSGTPPLLIDHSK